MKKKYLLSVLLLHSGLFIAQSHAQTVADSLPVVKQNLLPEEIERNKVIDNTKVIVVNSEPGEAPSQDSIRSLMTRFYVNQFRHFQDPRTPYFMFMSKDANLAMGVGGVVRMRGWFDWNGSVPANGFAPVAIQIPKQADNMKTLKATPAGTALFFSMIGRNQRIGDFMGYIEANFNGYEHLDFRLKKAYFIVNDWEVGYDDSSFSDPAAQPPTIDGAGPNGRISKTNVLVRYMHTFKDKWTVAGSFEFPQSGVTDQAGLTQKCSDYVPDIAAFGQYQWDGGYSHVRLAGLLRTISYRDLLLNKTKNTIGWGVQLSSVFKIVNPLSVYALAAYGNGIGSYMGDIADNKLDLVPDADHPGKLTAPAALGLTFGAKYNFTSNIFACISLSELNYFAEKPKISDDYRYGLYGSATLFWDITPRVRVGAEYLAAKRVNNGGAHANANRVDALFQFSF